MTLLRCTACRATYSLETPVQRCTACNEPVEVELELTAGMARPDQKGSLLKRYQSMLPFDQTLPALGLGEGTTPLLQTARLGPQCGFTSLYIKNEGLNPTGSFKDRGSLSGIQRARSLGFERVGTVSTGNMAASVAAYAARTGLECVVLISKGIPQAKLASINVYNPHLIEVDGDYGQLYFDSLALGPELGIYFINSDDPFRVEGQKTLAFDVVAQLEWTAPDVVLIPVSSGGNLSAVLKGFKELEITGLIDAVPRVYGVQAAGCAPIAKAFTAGASRIERWGRVETIAHAIANPYPPSGNRILRQRQVYDKLDFVSVDEREIRHTYYEMARTEGIFGQPDAAVPLAAAIKLREAGLIAASDTVVTLVSGNGLKDTTILGDAQTEPIPTKAKKLADTLSALLDR